MQLKRFRGATVRDALAAARADLGPSALVLSTRMVAAHGLGGWLGRRVVEVTTAVDGAVSESRPIEAERRTSGPAPADSGRKGSSETAELVAAITARLTATGLDRVIAEEAARRVPARQRKQAPARELHRAVAERLQWLAAGDEPFAPVEVFVGPPGAGKTTTIAKIAAQQRVKRGVRLGLVAADGFRVGAVEQLRIYADIIGSPFSVARALPELETALAASRTPMLVDTAGRSPGDQVALELFGVFGTWTQARTHLVVPASTTPDALERLADAYAVARPTRVVFTKVDEAGGLAPLMAVLRRRDLVVSYLTNGQRVPEDLARATPALLAAHVLGERPNAGDR
jgi:flagellar biosynthesis protein FlhF